MGETRNPTVGQSVTGISGEGHLVTGTVTHIFRSVGAMVALLDGTVAIIEEGELVAVH